MKKHIYLILLSIGIVCAETLFEVKDSLNNTVFDVSTDGVAIMNLGDTLMVISTKEIKAVIDDSKALSRKFSVSTTSAKKGLYTDLFDVSLGSATMREGSGLRYTNFGPKNIFIGSQAGNSITDGMNNLFFGNKAGYNTLGNFDEQNLEAGDNNVFIGLESGYSNTEGHGNIFTGYRSGYLNQTGSLNVYIGDKSGYSTTADQNTFVGNETGYSTSAGAGNSFFGCQAGKYCDEGDYNTFIGKTSGVFSDGSYNTFIGSGSGENNSAGSNNTHVGFFAGNSSSGSGCVFLGNAAGAMESQSNKLYIENSNSANPLIWGDFGTDMVKINGHFGVGVAPDANYGINVVDDYIGLRSYANTTGTYSYGIYGQADNATSQNVGIAGFAYGGGTSTNIGIYGYGNGGSSYWAGYFQGNINVTGTVIKSADKFRIDHPLDPENKYLNHSSVSSDEMKNIYDGIVVLDGYGKAVVVLPDWFEAMNSEYRYQMTAIGSPGPNLFVSKEVSNNSFEIAGGTPGMKVSWMITGTRNDNFAKANHIQIEEEKSSREKGYYINPEVFGMPAEKGIRSLYEKELELNQK